MKKIEILLVCLLLCGCGGGDKGVSRGDIGSLPDAKEEKVTDTLSWSQWRGPNRNGHAVNQSPLVDWSDKEILWKAQVPGRGHSSPIIVDDKIFLTSAAIRINKPRPKPGEPKRDDVVEQWQKLLCYDRLTGELLWEKEVHVDGYAKRIFVSNSDASETVATDGKSVFCKFVNAGEVMVTRFSLDGEQLWQKSFGKFKSDYNFGSGASPIFWDGKLIVTSESGVDPFIIAADPETGDEIWRIDRPKNTSYSTPVIGSVAGKYQLLISGLEAVKGYDPSTGKEVWSCPADWTVTCGTMVWHDDMVFASGGFPSGQTIAVKAEGSAKKVWSNQKKCYEQSMIVVDGYVYALADSMVCFCWEAETGKVMWQIRLKGRKVSASPVLANGNLYFLAEDGVCSVVKANPEKFELVAENQLGESAYATPAFVDDKIYARIGFGKHSARREWIYCVGNPTK
jgi:outer membrane protein assembly factor BamB